MKKFKIISDTVLFTASLFFSETTMKTTTECGKCSHQHATSMTGLRFVRRKVVWIVEMAGCKLFRFPENLPVFTGRRDICLALSVGRLPVPLLYMFVIRLHSGGRRLLEVGFLE